MPVMVVVPGSGAQNRSSRLRRGCARAVGRRRPRSPASPPHSPCRPLLRRPPGPSSSTVTAAPRHRRRSTAPASTSPVTGLVRRSVVIRVRRPPAANPRARMPRTAPAVLVREPVRLIVRVAITDELARSAEGRVAGVDDGLGDEADDRLGHTSVAWQLDQPVAHQSWRLRDQVIKRIRAGQRGVRCAVQREQADLRALPWQISRPFSIAWGGGASTAARPRPNWTPLSGLSPCCNCSLPPRTITIPTSTPVSRQDDRTRPKPHPVKSSSAGGSDRSRQQAGPSVRT